MKRKWLVGIVFAEMAALLFVIQAIMWHLPPEIEVWEMKFWCFIGLACMLGMILRWRLHHGTFGLKPLGFLRSYWLVLLAIIVSSGMLLYGLHWNGLDYSRFRLSFWKPGYYPFVVLQLLLLMVCFIQRLEFLLGPGKIKGVIVVLLGSLIFSLCHLPNPILMLVTFAGGILLCAAYRHSRDILNLALAQILISCSLTAIISDQALCHMRVGKGCVEYQANHPTAMRLESLFGK